jgi:hypothetical protein
MKTKAGIERAVVDVLRKLGFLDPALKGPPLITDGQSQVLKAARWLLAY